MKRMSLFISADSEPIHIAHALEIPLIDIIGPVDPDEQAQDNDISIIVKPSENIKPSIFSLKRQDERNESIKTMDVISVNAVYNAFEILFNKIKKNRPV
jgi:ADP-heptose:LPS heptosyltransferase